MNSLFYVGIIVPTVITIALFLIFIYCWLLQRARREVLTKKYDPHGRMRNLGMSMNAPRPPTFCLLEDVLLSDVGEDNVAYDISRSPSTQQDWRGRALYHTYHDSGISAGLSPTQENEPRHGLVYRTCPDSGVSELSALQPIAVPHRSSTGCCQIDEVGQGQPQLQQVGQGQPQLQQVGQDHVYLDTCEQQQQSPHVVLCQSQVQASVHLNPAVSCSKLEVSMAAQTHHSPQTQPTTSLLAGYNQRHGSVHTPSTPTVCTPQLSMPPLYHELSHDPSFPQSGPLAVHSEQIRTLDCWREGQGSNSGTKHHIPLDNVNSHLKGHVTPFSAAHLYDLPFPPPPPPSSSCAIATAANVPKQFYRDSGVMDGDQTPFPGPDRPDSPASHSSTTDSEDSGFRSSYCAAHRKAVLSKQEHPLLKSLRKTKRTKNHRKSSWKNSQNNPADCHRPFVPLNQENLPSNNHHVPVIEETLTSQGLIPRPLAARQHRSDTTSRADIEGNYTATSQDHAGLAACNHSPSSPQPPPKRNYHHSPIKNPWAPQSSNDSQVLATQSSNDSQVLATQTIHLMDISSHISSKYLPEDRAYSQPQPLDHARLLQACPPAQPLDHARLLQACPPAQPLDHARLLQACPPGSPPQAAADSHLDTFAYSVV